MENRCLRLLDDSRGHAVTAFGNTAPSFLRSSLPQNEPKALVNTTTYVNDATLVAGISLIPEIGIFWEIARNPLAVAKSR
jgi:hypothetical protein